MTVRLEHANIAVRDLDAMLAFIAAALPEFAVRGQGRNAQGGRWVHVGTQSSYLALNEVPKDRTEPWQPYGERPGLNHLGFVVPDAAAVAGRLAAGGYRESTVPNDHPHRSRVYFFDSEGNDWEFVQYLATDPALRNDYGLPD
ncbi:MAG: VOC family protein [Pseudomonadales bacterium]